MLTSMPSMAPLKPSDKTANKPGYVKVTMLNNFQFVIDVPENKTHHQAATDWCNLNKKIQKVQVFSVMTIDTKVSIIEIAPKDTQSAARTGNTKQAGARTGNNTSKTPCKWGAQCPYHAKGTCTFAHSSSESASVQGASDSI